MGQDLIIYIFFFFVGSCNMRSSDDLPITLASTLTAWSSPSNKGGNNQDTDHENVQISSNAMESQRYTNDATVDTMMAHKVLPDQSESIEMTDIHMVDTLGAMKDDFGADVINNFGDRGINVNVPAVSEPQIYSLNQFMTLYTNEQEYKPGSETIVGLSSQGESLKTSCLIGRRFKLFITPTEKVAFDMICFKLIGEGNTACIKRNCKQTHKGGLMACLPGDAFVAKSNDKIFVEPDINVNLFDEEIIEDWRTARKPLQEWNDLFLAAKICKQVVYFKDQTDIDQEKLIKAKTDQQLRVSYRTPAKRKMLI